MKPKLSLEACKKVLAEMKKRTKCSACGKVEHWGGDPECKKKALQAPKTGFVASYKRCNVECCGHVSVTKAVKDYEGKLPRSERTEEKVLPALRDAPKESEVVSVLQDAPSIT